MVDRGYLDFERLYRFTLSTAFFVTRAKENVVLQRRYSDALRRISYVDAKTNHRLTFLTNNFVLPALTIARIYKCRWQVELFFKWIQQPLRINAFFGARKTQTWIAVSVYVLVAIVRKRFSLAASLYQILPVLSITLFEKAPILEALQPLVSDNDCHTPGNHLQISDF